MSEEREQHELDKIRMRKMQAMMEAKKRQEQTQQASSSIYEKVDYVLRTVLHPDAYTHLMNIKSKEPHVYQAIFNELVSEDVIQSIDYLVTIIQQRGGVNKQIPLDVIILLERKMKGIKGKIQVKRGDSDAMDLGSYLTK